MVRATSRELCSKVGGQGVKRDHRVGGSHVNQWNVCPFSDIGNTWQRIASSVVYRLTWVMYTSRCLFGSMVSFYFSMVKFFHVEGTIASMMPRTKGFLNCNNYLPTVLKDGVIMFERTLGLVALGKLTAVDFASPPSGELASGCRDLCASWRFAFSRRRATISSTWCFCISETWACSLLTIEDMLV